MHVLRYIYPLDRGSRQLKIYLFIFTFSLFFACFALNLSIRGVGAVQGEWKVKILFPSCSDHTIYLSCLPTFTFVENSPQNTTTLKHCSFSVKKTHILKFSKMIWNNAPHSIQSILWSNTTQSIKSQRISTLQKFSSMIHQIPFVKIHLKCDSSATRWKSSSVGKHFGFVCFLIAAVTYQGIIWKTFGKKNINKQTLIKTKQNIWKTFLGCVCFLIAAVTYHGIII